MLEFWAFFENEVLFDVAGNFVAVGLHETDQPAFLDKPWIALDGPDLDVDPVPGNGAQHPQFRPFHVQGKVVHSGIAQGQEDAKDGQTGDFCRLSGEETFGQIAKIVANHVCRTKEGEHSETQKRLKLIVTQT